MDFRRMLANAFARRIAYVVVAAATAVVLSLLGIGNARAHSNAYTQQCQTQGSSAVCDQEKAAGLAYGYPSSEELAHCVAYSGSNGGRGYETRKTVSHNTSLKAYYVKVECKGIPAPGQPAANWGVAGASDGFYYRACAAPKKWHEDTRTCADDCSVDQHWDDTFKPPNGSLSCDGGKCEVVYLANADGTYSSDRTGQTCKPNNTECDAGYYYIAGLNVCAPENPQECPEGTTNVGGQCNPRQQCPKGQHEGPGGACEPDNNQCPAGKTKAPDGSCVDNNCPAGQVRGKDGTCKKDGDGDGEEDEDDGSFAGGDDCSTPPQCSGDPILCGQARIQWRIDCNTRRNTNIAGGSCAAVPICTGEKCDAMEYSQLLQQWKSACALEKLADGEDGDGEDKQPEWTKVTGMSQDPGQGENAEDREVVTTSELSTDAVDTGGWLGGGGGCPGIVTAGGSGGMMSGFAQALASPPPYFCDWVGVIAAVLLVGAATWCAIALGRG